MVGEEAAAARALIGLKREAKQKFAALPGAPGIVTVMSAISKAGTARLSIYAVNKAALGSLELKTTSESTCTIKVTVQLIDTNGNELDSSEHDLEPADENRAGTKQVP
jgi:short-subunit dehydrogenase